MFPKQGSKAENTQVNADITLFVNKIKLYAISIELADAARCLFTLWLDIKSLFKNEADANIKNFFSNFKQLLLSLLLLLRYVQSYSQKIWFFTKSVYICDCT